MKKISLIFLILLFLNNYKLAQSNQIPASKQSLSFTVPNVLSERDKKVYLEIYKHQIQGNWEELKKKIRLLDNKILLGYLEYDKLMHPNKYKASYDELSSWLLTYNDFPVVMKRRVYNLMIKRSSQKKKISHKLQKPKYGNYLRGYGENKKYYRTTLKNQNQKKSFYITEDITNLIIIQDFDKLLRYYLDNKDTQLDVVHYLQKDAEKKYFRGFIKESLNSYKFLENNINIKRPENFFKSGLIVFKLKDKNEASIYFNKCNEFISSSSNQHSPHLKAACLYWAAKVSSSKKAAKELYIKAAKFDRTMYGQLAIEKLKKKESFVWKKEKYETFTDNNNNILSLNSFQRLIALSELNFYDKADLEMRNLYSQLGKKNVKLLYHLSEKLDLAAVQIRLAETFYNKDNILFIRGIYPTPEWNLNTGFLFDKAFIYALIRKESAFNLKAKSSKGARGLMQLMPRTASKIKKDHRLRYGNTHQLYSLDLNLELGQKLLKELVEDPNTKNQVLSTLIAYNAGITRVKKWNKTIDETDPLAFIESIPIKETRMFVKEILTDFWIYRDKLGQNKPSRAMLANDKWPIFSYQDFKIARDAKLR